MIIMDNKTTIEELKKLVVKFRDERDWKKYHKPKDLAASINIEAAELLEQFQWKSDEEINEMLKDENKFDKISDELADIIDYCLSFSDVTKIDVSEALKKKIEENKKKYPVEKFKGDYKKYNEL
jgi:NTP pyrophosphatase (non-canonical NTP hydrolase)